jgi:hypothetical protein
MKLTILYTANLRGQIELLPRLYTFLRQQGPADLLIDLGDACDDAIWHCQVTGGRSMLHVLDAMGYHAANTSVYLDQQGHAKLLAQPLGLALIGPGDFWLHKGVLFGGPEFHTQPSYRLHILTEAAASTQLEKRSLQLASVPAGSIGKVILDTPAIVEQAILPMPDSILPDPTIAATVDFVLDEARYYRQRRE